MSDISLHWSVLDYTVIALFTCGPGALVGLIVGAVGWTEHRIRGALLGAIEGFLLFFCYLQVYIESNLSVSASALSAIPKALAITWLGVLAGGAAGAWLWRRHRVLGAIAGAPAGFVVFLYGWWFLT